MQLTQDPVIASHFSGGFLWGTFKDQASWLQELGRWSVELGAREKAVAEESTIAGRIKLINDIIDDRPILLIFDDVGQHYLDLDADKNWITRLGGNQAARIVTTMFFPIAAKVTRNQKNWKKIEGLNKQDALLLLQKNVPKAVFDIAEKDCLDILDKVDYMPHAIVEVARVIGEKTYGLVASDAKFEIDKLIDSIHQGKGKEVFGILDLQLEALSPIEREMLISLSVFPPSPNSFDRDASKEVCSVDNTVEFRTNMNALVRAGLLNSCESPANQTRYFLTNYIHEYLHGKMTNNAPVFRRFVHYFIDFVTKNRHNDDQLEQEQGNIISALELAYEQCQRQSLITGVNALYRLIQNRGLYDIAHVHLKRAQIAAKEIYDEAGLCEVLYNLGRVYLFKAEYGHAKESFDDGIAHSQHPASKALRSDLHLGLAQISLRDGRFEDAIGLCREWIEIEKNDENRTDVILQFYAIWGESEDLLGNYPAANKKLEEGLTIATKDEQKICLLAHQGWVAAHQGKFDIAQQCWEKGLKWAENIGDIPHTIFLNANLSWVLDRLGRLPEAEARFKEGIGLADQYGYQYGRSVLLTNRGAALIHQGDYDEAKRRLEQSEAIDRQSEHAERIGVTLENLGILFSKLGEFSTALKRYQEGLDVAEKSKIPERICAIETFLGDVYQNLDNFNEAKSHFDRALTYAERLNNPERSACLFKHYGITLDKQNRREEAEKQLQMALGEAQKINYRWLISSIHNALGICYLGMGAPDLANKQFKLALSIGDEIKSVDMTAAALFGLAQCPQNDDEVKATRDKAMKSLNLYRSINHFKARGVQDWLKNYAK